MMLSERSKMQKASCYMTPFILNVQNRQTYRDRKQMSWLGWGVGERNHGESLLMVTGSLLGGDENDPKLDSGDGYRTV